MQYVRLMLKYLGIFCCIIIASSIANAQARVSGSIDGIKDTTLTFYTYKDYISYTEHPLITFSVDSKGYFSTPLPITDTCFLFTNINGERHYFFGIPNAELSISITPTRPLGSPYQHSSTARKIEVKGDGGFNAHIQKIDEKASHILEEWFRQKSGQEPTSDIAVLLEQAKQTAEQQEKTSFATQYALAKVALAESYVCHTELSKFINSGTISYHNPSYMEVFNQCYTFSIHTSFGDSLKQAINKKLHVGEVQLLVAKHFNIGSEQLAELATLKVLHNLFYEQAFKRAPILAMLDSLAQVSPHKEHREISKNVKEKLQELTVGYAPPPFNLHNTSKQEVNLEQLKGKYVYLNFTSVNSYAAIQDFIHLKKLHDKYHKQVEFVSICLDSEHDVQYFAASEGYTWSFIACGNDAAIAHWYNVKILPSYFLIGKDGKLLQAPAHRPNEGIEAIFKKMLK